MNGLEMEKLRKQLSALGFQFGRQYKEIMHRLSEHQEVTIRNIQELQRKINDLSNKIGGKDET